MHTSRHFQCLRYMEAAINLLVTIGYHIDCTFSDFKIDLEFIEFFNI